MHGRIEGRTAPLPSGVLIRLASTEPSTLCGCTVAQWLGAVDLSAAALRYVGALIRFVTFANAPDRLSADVVVAQLQAAGRGVTYLDGGWGRLVAAQVSGLRVRPCSTSRLERVDDNVVTHRSDGTTVISRSAVVAVGDPDRSHRRVGWARRADTQRPVRRRRRLPRR